MHQALYRKWRPQNFDDVYGQEHITSILKYETENGLFCHAYLFCGSRGTGKTTCAKILAKAVNCEHPVNGSPCGECDSCRAIASGMTTDVLEMDAASNNKVDDVRSILDEVVYTPSSLKYRVYIVDEVHMLSASAFNALLKTLEEPPEHVIFILATTEMQKLPATIISRCQRFDFHRIQTATLMKRLKYIAENENIRLDDDAALMLARLAQGGMRDAISLFELCAAGGRDVTAAAVSETVGVVGREAMSRTVRAIVSRDTTKLFDIVADIDSSAKDIGVFWQELIGYYRDMMVIKTASPAAAVKYLDLTDSETEMLRADADSFRRETLSYHCRLLDDAYTAMQRAGASRRTVAELTLIRLCDERLGTSPEALLARISALEAKIASGVAFAGNNTAPQNVAIAQENEFPEPPPETAGEGFVPYVPDDISPAPVKRTETAKTPAPVRPSAKTETAADVRPAVRPEVKSAPTSAARVLRPLRQWTEIVEGFGSVNPGVAALLASEKAYTDSTKPGKIVICYTKEITKMMLSGVSGNAFCQSASLVLDRPVNPGMLIWEKVTPDAAPNDAQILIDELSDLADSAE